MCESAAGVSKRRPAEFEDSYSKSVVAFYGIHIQTRSFFISWPMFLFLQEQSYSVYFKLQAFFFFTKSNKTTLVVFLKNLLSHIESPYADNTHNIKAGTDM